MSQGQAQGQMQSQSPGQEMKEITEMVKEGEGETPWSKGGVNITERAARILTDSRRPEQSKENAPGQSETKDEEQIAKEEPVRQSRTRPETKE
jgi:hypothetical protein